MKYKLSIQKRNIAPEYKVIDGVLVVDGIGIIEPIDTSIVEYDIGEGEKALSITKCYREDGEVICHLTLFVTDKWPYVTGDYIRNGIKGTKVSQWDFTKLFTADEVINGNYVPEVIEDV